MQPQPLLSMRSHLEAPSSPRMRPTRSPLSSDVRRARRPQGSAGSGCLSLLLPRAAAVITMSPDATRRAAMTASWRLRLTRLVTESSQLRSGDNELLLPLG